ncbi:uncharacterized protein N7503_002701 [Penicillium pulvis]|uniref:uncharacterized protein n=1 Tax=Penicillium pulvis TaxID=1562058 RepID=UPI0025484699|nr:uncharacterized protein N7503_002701 [Penicillium pulvis]KAJ5810483.1 hypothetical protein N7503_002701 [Penicillium pulvis]
MHTTRREKLVEALSRVPEYALAPSRPSNPQTMNLGGPPLYTAFASPSTIAVPIGLIMYTRKGWHTS